MERVFNETKTKSRIESSSTFPFHSRTKTKVLSGQMPRTSKHPRALTSQPQGLRAGHLPRVVSVCVQHCFKEWKGAVFLLDMAPELSSYPIIRPQDTSDNSSDRAQHYQLRVSPKVPVMQAQHHAGDWH